MKKSNESLDEYSPAKKKDGVPDDVFTSLVTRVFAKKDGQDLLRFLKEGYIEAPVAPLGCIEGYAQRREGQNDIIRLFIQISKGANG